MSAEYYSSHSVICSNSSLKLQTVILRVEILTRDQCEHVLLIISYLIFYCQVVKRTTHFILYLYRILIYIVILKTI